jgi:uncharacterized protein (TIGR00297 family)
MINNGLGILLILSLITLIIAVSTILQKLNILGGEGSRKLIHIGVSNSWIIIMIFFDNVWLACIPPVIFILLNYISYKKDLIKSMERSEKDSLGTVYYPISLLIMVLVTFWLHMTYLGAIGILILGYGDGLAGIIGKKYGKRKLYLKKTFEGTTAMFVASLIVALVVLSIFTPSIAIAGSLLIATAATAIELYTPRDLDNLSVPIGSAATYYGLIIIGSSAVTTLLIALALNLVIALVAYKRKSLDLSGVITALIVGILIYMFAGATIWLILMLFFISSSFITHLKNSHKAKLSSEYIKSKRNYKQVLASGLMPTIFSIIYYFTRFDVILLAAVSTIAISCADTWASELGILNKGKTVLITTFKPVKKGESGGVSLYGTTMSAVGSLLIAATFIISKLLCSNISTTSAIFILVSVTMIGLAGSIIDSLLGASLQAKHLDSRTNLVTESRKSNGKINQKISGLGFMTNEMVNFTSSIIGGVVALVFFTVFLK